MTANEKRAQAVAYMKSRKRMNTYTNGGDRKYFFGKPDNKAGNTTQKGWSDCSSAVRKSIQAAAGIDIGYNTDDQLRNRSKGIVVDQTDGYYPDESKLLPGDCLYFKGNRYHTLNVGHVEMYTGSNECYGHGSGTGPNRHNLHDYCKSRATSEKRYFMAIRWINDSDENTDTTDTPTLKKGGYGDSVVRLQTDLITLGYDIGKWGADGEFGSSTENAVKAYQTAKGLTADGIVGAATWAALNADMELTHDSDEDQPDTTANTDLTVSDGSWNVRTAPSKEASVAAVVHGGDKLESVNADGWTAIKLDGEIRWISDKAVGKA